MWFSLIFLFAWWHGVRLDGFVRSEVAAHLLADLEALEFRLVRDRHLGDIAGLHILQRHDAGCLINGGHGTARRYSMNPGLNRLADGLGGLCHGRDSAGAKDNTEDDGADRQGYGGFHGDAP